MTKDLPGEQWKEVRFDFAFTNNFRLEISNYGRLRTFNKISDGNIIKGSVTEGYRIVRLKLYRPRDEKTKIKLENLQQQVVKLSRKIKLQKEGGESLQSIKETSSLLESFRKNLSQKFQQDLKERTMNIHFLVHRLVADYFLAPARATQTIVAHLDHDKKNNRATNLKWMTPE